MINVWWREIFIHGKLFDYDRDFTFLTSRPSQGLFNTSPSNVLEGPQER